jgi:hypothetical protein
MSRVERFRDPFGRPAGLPEAPGTNWPAALRAVESWITGMSDAPFAERWSLCTMFVHVCKGNLVPVVTGES